MDLGLKGKVALVTGAGSQIGFGHEIALLLAKEGCDAVAVTDINIDDCNKTADAVKKLGKKSIAVKADVTSQADVAALVKKVMDTYKKIDILCNVAGAIVIRPSATASRTVTALLPTSTICASPAALK